MSEEMTLMRYMVTFAGSIILMGVGCHFVIMGALGTLRCFGLVK